MISPKSIRLQVLGKHVMPENKNLWCFVTDKTEAPFIYKFCIHSIALHEPWSEETEWLHNITTVQFLKAIYLAVPIKSLKLELLGS
jgi:hypothetical protein